MSNEAEKTIAATQGAFPNPGRTSAGLRAVLPARLLRRFSTDRPSRHRIVSAISGARMPS